ncbi:MAG: class I tRNA ligase family protein, partial [Clostridiales bacterium]|nr:class I tRNA ligase family protein [Clostridiales bacterium]
DFIWDEFCDWYIELVKPRLFGDTANAGNPQNVLVYVLSNALKLLHPFMPFITEEIYSYLPGGDGSIMTERWRDYDEKLTFAEESARLETVKDAIKAVRNLRAEMNVPPSKKAKLVIVTDAPEIFGAGEGFFKRLAGAGEVIVTADKGQIPENAVSLVTPRAEIYMPQSDLVDKEKEIARLEGEQKRLIAELGRVEGKLSNEGFVQKAPPAVIAQEREKGEKYKAMLEKVVAGLENLK